MASPSHQTHLALTTVPSPHPRRLPPPCWSHDETSALIDAYKSKWYSLRRGNLRANHWQEVADAVSAACPLVEPAKTPVQCRHKMEKLRKRYRNDLNRSAGRANGAVSSWVHFGLMHDMERGPGIEQRDSRAGFGEVAVAADEDDGDQDEDEELYQSIRQGVPNNGFRLKSAGFGSNPNFVGGTRVVGNGFRGNNFAASYDPRSSIGGASSRVMGNGYYNERAAGFGEKKRGREREVEGVAEALRGLREGYVRVERMKMEMAREVEAMRMEMEMKRTEMILESQQQIVQAFVSAVSEDKRNRRMGSPEP